MDYAILVILSLFAVGAMAAIDEKILMEHVEGCKKKHSLNDDEIKAVMRGDYSAEKSKCFLTCVGEKIGYIQDQDYSERGALKAIDMMMSNASEADKKKAHHVVVECSKTLKKNPTKGCEIGPAAAHCLAEGSFESGIVSMEDISKMQSN